MAPRDGDGSVIPRTVTSCASCLAWGMTFAQGICLSCYNFAARYRHEIGTCGACARPQLLKKGYCRLCWCQARENRTAVDGGARSAVVVAAHLPDVRHHQLFVADLAKRTALPRTAPRRYGAKGRPPKPAPAPAAQPCIGWQQQPLFDDIPVRDYTRRRVDLRREPAPDNPWLAWALHLAHRTAETRGWDPIVRRGMQRVLVTVLAGHADGDTIRATDVQRGIARHSTNLDYVLEILATMDVLVDDRPRTFDRWLDTRLGDTPAAIRADARAWALTLHDGGPRARARTPSTAYSYLRTVEPVLRQWGRNYRHLREVTRDDIVTYLGTVQARDRQYGLVALRSLFGWAKRGKLIFRNPTARMRVQPVQEPIWQPLQPDDVSATIEAATTPQAQLFVALAAVHAARPGQIRAIRLDDVDIGNRRITIAGRQRPLDDLTRQVLTAWLRHRRDRWPDTANPHLIINIATALGLGPVSATFLAPLMRGLTASIERLRIDRQLDEAIASGADPLHLVEVFGVHESTGIKYANAARQLLDTPIECNPAVHNEPTESLPHTSPNGTAGSR